MVGILIICGIGMMCSIFPELALALNLFIMVAVGLGIVFFISDRYHQYKLDQEAFYGPLDELEKEEEKR